MKIIVITVTCIPDQDILSQIEKNSADVDLENVSYKLNPFDMIALEEALLIKEKRGGEVVILSMGPLIAKTEILTGLAMGADRGILVEHEELIEPVVFARALKKIVERENPDLVLMGKQSMDNDFGQTGQMLAWLLGWDQACFATEVSIDNNRAIVKRETDGYLETLDVPLPGVITVGLTRNTPRYISLPGARKAKQKKIEIVSLKDLKVNITQWIKRISVESPSLPVEQCELFNNVDGLVKALRTDNPEIFSS